MRVSPPGSEALASDHVPPCPRGDRRRCGPTIGSETLSPDPKPRLFETSQHITGDLSLIAINSRPVPAGQLPRKDQLRASAPTQSEVTTIAPLSPSTTGAFVGFAPGQGRADAIRQSSHCASAVHYRRTAGRTAGAEALEAISSGERPWGATGHCAIQASSSSRSLARSKARQAARPGSRTRVEAARFAPNQMRTATARSRMRTCRAPGGTAPEAVTSTQPPVPTCCRGVATVPSSAPPSSRNSAIVCP